MRMHLAVMCDKSAAILNNYGCCQLPSSSRRLPVPNIHSNPSWMISWRSRQLGDNCVLVMVVEWKCAGDVSGL